MRILTALRTGPALLAAASLLAAVGAPALGAGTPPGAGPGGRGPTAVAAVDPLLATGRTDAVDVVVQVDRDARAAAQRAVRSAGGRVGAALPIVDAFAASLPGRAVARLAAVPGVRVVSADRPVAVQADAPTTSAGSLAPRPARAPAAWSGGAAGQGVTVALVDTGVADVPDLAGRVVPVQDERTGRTASCYDLSGEGTCADSYGHGTFMAGLIAGNGAAGAATGTAPRASVLSVKVAGADGAADVSTVLAAIQWVVSFRQQYGVRVLNLSLGTDSAQSWRHDPLNYAVQRAWDAGILVVVAASNRGPEAGTIAKPGDDPWVVTVGAVDDRRTTGSSDDTVPDFSGRGPTAEGLAKPDLVAPGAHVLSLRAPGSTLDRRFPPADPSSPYRSGSGTSMAAAVVSGAGALAFSKRATTTPDEVKHALVAAARGVASEDPSLVGAGLVDAATTALRPEPGRANAGLARSDGQGSLDASRGSLSLRADDPLGTVLTGRQTAQLLLWDPAGYTTGSWAPRTWYTSAHAAAGWNTATWAGDLEGHNWTGHNWTGHNWTGHNWTGASWYGERDADASYGRSGPGSASYGAWD